MQDAIRNEIQGSIAAKQEVLAKLVPDIEKTARIIINALKNSNKILICGNGGSAADAQHFAGELIVRFETERRSLPAIALTTDTSILTAGANDYGYDEIFARQVNGLGNKGDVLVAISTSGNSPNILKAIEAAKTKGMEIIGLTGKDGGKMKALPNSIIIPSNTTARIQESHIMIIHTWCKLVDAAFAK
ncbi:MAG: D-sedoheptulose 7-phosphate isomerase [Candidatus Woesearchaeota archaeon]